MKKILLIMVFLFGSLIFLNGCTGTNNFCNYDTRIRATEVLTEEFNNKTEAAQAFLDANPNGTLQDYINANLSDYQTEILNSMPTKTCIVTEDSEIEITTDTMIEKYGPSLTIGKKTWSLALNQGLIEFMLVFPISLLLIGFGKIVTVGGISQIFAIFMTTFLFRGLITLISFKSMSSQAKMQELLPEQQRITAKYQNSTDPNAKQLMSQEIMQLYSKSGVNPFGFLLTIVWQFPLLIGMWGAVSEVFFLQQDSLLGVNLSFASSRYILGTEGTSAVVIIVFILLAVLQFVSFKMSTWLSAKKNKNNPNARVLPKAKNPMGKMIYVFMALMLFSAWNLPFGLSIYWIANTIAAILSSLIVFKIQHREKKDKNIVEVQSAKNI